MDASETQLAAPAEAHEPNNTVAVSKLSLGEVQYCLIFTHKTTCFQNVKFLFFENFKNENFTFSKIQN